MAAAKSLQNSSGGPPEGRQRRPNSSGGRPCSQQWRRSRSGGRPHGMQPQAHDCRPLGSFAGSGHNVLGLAETGPGETGPGEAGPGGALTSGGMAVTGGGTGVGATAGDNVEIADGRVEGS
ncbi:insulin receptor substrate 4 [Oreochromis niloticus]|uniref:insulin receptor substrate 4 n=1 Tax=Oreochromis niloticus TaxID=8128 RepID=UPI0009046EAD|nr:insulin receptor substrate 4 [Oreochromis niloticus]